MNAPGRPMTLRAVDHLVVAAASLEQGAAWCEAAFGVAPGPGGKHALMGTHNRLLAIGSARFPQAYLEILAIDPQAPPPGRARWFGLDDPALQERLRAGPRLLHWVARTATIEQDRRALIDRGQAPGEVVHATRGALSWRILLRPDGADRAPWAQQAVPPRGSARLRSGPAALSAGGALPTLIQWDDAHPTDAMGASGVTLQTLALRGLPAPIHAWLALPVVDRLDGPGPALHASLATPRGPVILES